MKKLIALLLAAMMCLSLRACGGNSGSNETQAKVETAGSSESEQTAPPETENPEVPAAPGLELSDDLADFTVSIEGVVYQLPCSPQVFWDNGWLPVMDWILEADYEYPGDSEGYFDLNKADENKEISLKVCNLSKDSKPLDEILVIGISNEVDTDVEFALSGGFALTNSTTEAAVFSVMGSDYTHSEFNGDLYEYYFPGIGRYQFGIRDGVLVYFEMKLVEAMYKN